MKEQKFNIPFIALIAASFLLIVSFFLPFASADGKYKDYLKDNPKGMFAEEIDMTNKAVSYTHLDISQLLNVSQTAVSHQLRVLKTNKLVKSRKEGKNVFYSLADDHVYSILNQGMEHLSE